MIMKSKRMLNNVVLVLLAASVSAVFNGCGTGRKASTDNQFFTSGNREADQRASQRMAQAEQLLGSGEGAGEKDKGKKVTEAAGTSKEGERAPGKVSLYERLGGDAGITKIVDDFLPRAVQDPRVNWDRSGVTAGNIFHHQTVNWSPTPDNMAQLKKHMVEFFALATGGPAHYTGREIQSAHANMKISNPEFDAAVGDLKASLDRLQVPNEEQKELLAIVESTRPQIVTQR
jgi:hemoglobin